MEKLLLFGTTDTEYIAIKQIASRMKIACEYIEPRYYSHTLGSIESGAHKSSPGYVPADTFCSAAAPSQAAESLLVMCGLSDKRMDKLLFELRHSNIRLDYKAVPTPTNRSWNISRLFFDLRREKAACQQTPSAQNHPI